MRQTCLQTLPSSEPRHPLSGESLVTTLRLYAGAVRRSAGTEAANLAVLKNVLDIVNQLCPFSNPTNALTRLRISRAMLAAQPLHAFSQQLAAAAAALEPCGGGGGGGGSGAGAAAAVEQGRASRAALQCFLENMCTFFDALLVYSDTFNLEFPTPELAAAVAAERAAGVEELARGLAESCVLEHAARVLLLLQARGPQAVRPREGAGLALSALQDARRQLPARDASARQSQHREEWWRLAAGALAYGGEFLQYEGNGTDPQVVAWELRQLVTEPLLELWPNGRRDLDTLPAEPPAEVAAALAGGLPQALMYLVSGSGTGALSAGSQCVASELLAACDALFLTPLLAYGDPEWAAALLAALGSAQGDEPAQAKAPPPSEQAAREFPALQLAAGVVGAVAEALRRCSGAALAGADLSPSRLGAAEPAPLQQLRRLVAGAEAQLGCLPPAP
ncbi:hypothetical protein HYH03_009443 [Edaphochlamys debaryana]|uniref:Uncharacterized protein n=1 Tax=Edaphochlamys debaryana TaxID=47281 RepID=A0A835XXV5_9CHLO|nr:hypothetical protein HYH03_009443 [Edaphochlamys debaryana]|eukprot:KAG2492196.1 hypothetical protein HYH03_009443 [Edaphochlamys debaryana]